MMKKFLLSLTLMAAGMMSASAATLQSEARTADNRVVYEVFVRNFSSNSRLSSVTAQLQRLKDLGVDVVWLMPIQKGGDKNRWGTYSSPYAVKDYTSIDPLYGTAADMTELVETAHSLGLEVWLDWVANHTSTDAVWTTTHPEYYGSSFKNPMGWNDVYQLDYTNTEMRKAMIEAMKYWVSEFDIDGFRCDYAEGVPVDFWTQARREVDAIKPLTWLAESAGEGNNVNLVKNAFDYNYAWKFNDMLLEAGKDEAVSDKVSAAGYLLHNARDVSNYSGGKSRLVYLSNHDVVQDKKGTPDRHFGDNLKAMTVYQFTAYGMPLIYNGQEINYSAGQVLLAEKTVINWNKADSEITDLITQLTRLKHSCPVLNAGSEGGSFIRHNAGGASDRVLVYERRKGSQSLVVMLNFSAKDETISLSTLPSGKYNEYFSGAQADFSTTHRFVIPAKGYYVFTRNDDSPIAEASYKMYVDDQTGWGTTYVYAWGDNNAKEAFGGWPGTQNATTATLSDGVTYKVWNIPQSLWGFTYHLIFNRSTSQAPDFDCSFDGDVMLKLTSSAATKKSLLPELSAPDYASEPAWNIEAGVDMIPADSDPANAPVEYYNLQGIKVVNPASGIYIRRQGSKTTKVLIH